MKALIIFVLLTVFSGRAIAGNLIENAVITKIASSSNGVSDDFFIAFSTGTGVCAATKYVVFPRSLAPSDHAFNRMYSTALAAFTAKKRIRVFAYNSDECNKASFIEIFD